MAIHVKAEFYQGHEGQLFRLLRRPDNLVGHIVFISPLFEQANQTRHMVTRVALSLYHLGYQSIVFDHFGTGDSSGELGDSSLTCWQQDILLQLTQLKVNSTKPIIVSAPLSAALLLNNDILAAVDGLQLWQPEFNGKRFIQQFKRLSLAANLNNNHSKPTSKKTAQAIQNIAGYCIPNDLLDELDKQTLTTFKPIKLPCHWFEWLAPDAQLPVGRAKQQAQFKQQTLLNTCCINWVTEPKFWQMSELTVSEQLLSLILHSLVAQGNKSSAMQPAQKRHD